MSTGSVRTTAQIIPFPAGGRKAAGRDRPTAPPVTDLETQAAAIAAGEAWYHEAAIQDARRGGER